MARASGPTKPGSATASCGLGLHPPIFLSNGTLILFQATNVPSLIFKIYFREAGGGHMTCLANEPRGEVMCLFQEGALKASTICHLFFMLPQTTTRTQWRQTGIGRAPCWTRWDV